MKATRRLFAGLVVVAGLGFAPSAVAAFFDRFILPAPAQGAAQQNNEVAPEGPADDACDVASLQRRLDAMLDQRRELKRDWKQAQREYRSAKAGDASRSKVRSLKKKMDGLKKRLKRIDARINNLRTQINRCQPGAAPPLPELNDYPELDEDDALVDERLDVVGMKISCRVPPGAETTSVLFRNVGQKLIPAGTPVSWSVRVSDQQGQFSLPQNLPVGAELTAADLLKLGVPGNASCQSRL